MFVHMTKRFQCASVTWCSLVGLPNNIIHKLGECFAQTTMMFEVCKLLVVVSLPWPSSPWLQEDKI